MKKIFQYSIILLGFLAFSSCEKALIDSEPATTNAAIFEQIWKFADEKYSFFEYKNVDWAAMKTKYQSRVSENMSQEEFLKVCDELLDNLKDGHVNIKTNFDRTRNWSFVLDYPVNFDKKLIERNYYKDKEKFVGPFEYFDFGNVAYVYYSAFGDDFSKENLDYIIAQAQGKKGIIIDIRDNLGGAASNVNLIAERFCKERVKLGESWRKSGAGHNDFVKSALYLDPNEEVTRFLDKPVVVLTNRQSYSAATFFPFTMKALPNVTLIGDTSGGGGGVPAFTELSNGWILRVSSTQTFDSKGFNIENGVLPTIKIDLDPAQALVGKDAILERALKFIRD